MALGQWLRRFFSDGRLDDEAAAREEFGVPDRGQAALEAAKFAGRRGGAEGAEAAEAELDALKPPPHPRP